MSWNAFIDLLLTRCIHSLFRYNSKTGVALLTRSQAIEDVRHFIEYQKAHLLGMSQSRVILVGSHVGGSLAAWTQQKYPLLVDGVWATGAPFVSSDHLPVSRKRSGGSLRRRVLPRVLHSWTRLSRRSRGNWRGSRPLNIQRSSRCVQGSIFRVYTISGLFCIASSAVSHDQFFRTLQAIFTISATK